MAIQFINLNSGFASVPPSLMSPKRLIAIHIQKIRKPFAHKTISHPKLLAMNACVLLKRLLAVSMLTRVTPTKAEIRKKEMRNLL